MPECHVMVYSFIFSRLLATDFFLLHDPPQSAKAEKDLETHLT
jgi:hypothetical protein